MFDCVGAESFKITIESLGLDSTWILYGLMGGPKIPDLNLAPFLAKRISLISTTLRSRSDNFKTELIQDFK